MTRYRIEIKSWYHYDNLTIRNGQLSKVMPRYTPSWDANDAMAVSRLRRQKGIETGLDDLVTIALVAGPYATVWVGTLDGVIVPMDVPPSGWTYPSGEPLEPSWFWQWKPSERSEQLLLDELSDSNPLRDRGILKTLIPYNQSCHHGSISGIEAVDLIRLVGMVSKEMPWHIEFDDEAPTES